MCSQPNLLLGEQMEILLQRGHYKKAGDIFSGTEHVRPDEDGNVFLHSRPHQWTGPILVRHFDTLCRSLGINKV